MDDPKKLKHDKPEYVRGKPGIEDSQMHSERGDADTPPQVGGDPMDPPDSSVDKPGVALDRDKVREHDQERARQPRDPRDG